MLLVICTHYGTGARNGKEYTPERNICDMGWDETVKDIASGEWTNVTSVIQISTGHDVTSAIASQVASIWGDRDEPLAEWQKEFLQDHLPRKVRKLEAAE